MKTILISFLASACLWAMPEKFEIWFLSPDSAKESASYFDNKILYFKPLAMNNLQCQPMGDYCFDPQVGMYKPGEEPLDNVQADYSEADKLEDYNYERRGLGKERQKAACDENNHFDIFCAETKAKKEKAKFTIWFDISSSMKQVDFPGFDKMCQREAFLRLLDTECSFNGEMQIYGFNEGRKQLSTIDSVCLNHGLNDIDNIIRDIKASEAKRLIVITDIFEADEKLLNFVETSGRGSVKGIEKPMFAEDLKAQAPALRKACL